MVVSATEVGPEGLDMSVRDLAEYFYINNRLDALNHPERLQRLFDTIVYFFERVGLYKNTRKTVSMSCQSCHTPSIMS